MSTSAAATEERRSKEIPQKVRNNTKASECYVKKKFWEMIMTIKLDKRLSDHAKILNNGIRVEEMLWHKISCLLPDRLVQPRTSLSKCSRARGSARGVSEERGKILIYFLWTIFLHQLPVNVQIHPFSSCLTWPISIGRDMSRWVLIHWCLCHSTKETSCFSHCPVASSSPRKL